MSERGHEVEESRPNRWALRLYVVGQTPRSVTAVVNLRQFCERYLGETPYEIEVIDLLLNPELAQIDQIVVIPTLIRLLPKPTRKLFGDLSDTERVLAGLQI